MATLADQWDAPSTAPVTPNKREADRLAILQFELAKAQQRLSSGDPRAQNDIIALNREMGVKSAPTFSQPIKTLADLWDETPASKPAKEQAKSSELPTAAQLYNQFQEAKRNLGQKIIGASEAGLTALSGAASYPVSAIGGVVGTLASGKYGTPEGIQAGQKIAEQLQAGGTYQPRTAQGQQYIQELQKAFEASKLPPMGVPELAGMAPVMGAGAQQAAGNIRQIPKMAAELTPAPAPQGAMRSGGAAATTGLAELQAAIAQASPELAAELKKLKPGQISAVALENQLIADTLPIPVRLTKGQSLQDPSLISFERNDRGMSKQLANHFNEQNRALLENANLIKQKTGEGTYEVNHVGNSTRAIEGYQEIRNETQSGIKQAYEDLDKLGAGKLEIDSKTFGNNAMKALSEKEDIDFLPVTIKNKVEQYQNGKTMNFDQLDNFITQTSREIRKAQRAGDGNAVHALTLVRGEIEKLPLLNETAEAKVVADRARSLAAKEFGLLDKTKPTYNAVYADIVNGGADSKDFIPKTIFGTKNKQFAKALDIIADKPEIKQQLKSGTLDYMIRKSTDASGNFNTGKFREFVDNLEVNDKGAPLFGEDWQSIKNLSKTGQLIEARPRGSFVNESNSTVAALAKYAKTAAETGINVAAKGLPVGTMGRNFLENRAAAKEVKESLKPGAGIKLKDIGKE